MDGDFQPDQSAFVVRALLRQPHAIAAAAKATPAVLVVFDILQPGERDLRLPLSERRDWLLEHVRPGNGIPIVEHVETHGEALFHAIVEHDQEGIVPCCGR